MNSRETGRQQEARVCEFLERCGYEILEQNFYSRFGEIDIIARRDGTLVFVEVKYRRSTQNGLPEEAVDRKKRLKIIRTADYYRVRKRVPEDVPCRFDVICVCTGTITHHENAFDYGGDLW